MNNLTRAGSFVKELSDNNFVGVVTPDATAVYRKAGEEGEVKAGLCNAWIALTDAIAMLQAAGYEVRPVETEGETEDEMIERLAAEWEARQDAQWDAVSAHWGHD